MKLEPRKFLQFQFLVVTITVIAGCLVYYFAFKYRDGLLFGLLPLFNLGEENNVPTLISSLNLLLASALSYTLYKSATQRQEASRMIWLILALIFVYLALDEAASIHEKFKYARHLFPQFSFINPRHAWMVPGAILASIFFVLLLPKLFLLPRRTLVLLATSGIIFASGVFGMEFVGSWMLNHGVDPNSGIYATRRLLEEALEMYGIVMYNCIIVAELARREAEISIRFTAGST